MSASGSPSKYEAATQRGVGGTGVDANAVMEMGGSAVESARGSRATEATLRGFWTGYRALMGV